jgi:hypothetical protein
MTLLHANGPSTGPLLVILGGRWGCMNHKSKVLMYVYSALEKKYHART